MKKVNMMIAVVIAAYLLAGCAASSVAEEDGSRPQGPRPDAVLEEASESYKQRGDIEYARKAVKTLDAARGPGNRNFELEWTFARYSYFLGSRKQVKDAEAETVLKNGLSAALIAKRMRPDRPEGYFWYGAILGEQSKRSPVTVGVISVSKIRDAMTRVIEIDPMYQGASAYDALGQLEIGTRGLSGGSVEKAIEYYEKAVELNKNNAYTRLHLGEAYIANGKKAEGRKQLQFVLDMEPDPDYIPEYEEAVRDAKKLLAND